ncbi:MAG: hypothetical protein AAF488_13785 [Planctomycetota bacterium]
MRRSVWPTWVLGAALSLGAGCPDCSSSVAADPETGSAGNPGTTVFGELGGESDPLDMPSTYDETVAAPLSVVMHGTGGSGGSIVGAFREVADADGVLLLAPTYFDSDTSFPRPFNSTSTGGTP